MTNKKDLLIKIHAYVSSDGIIDTWKCKEIRGNNIRVRKRLRVRFYNQEEELIRDYLDAVRKAHPQQKYIRYSKKRSEIEIRSQIICKSILKLGKVSTKNWEVPKKLNNKQKIIWTRAFADCDGTVGHYNYNRYVAIDSINLNGLNQIANTLNKLRISSRIQKVKYRENTSYRLIISGKENLIKFNKIIGFMHPIKKKKLKEAIQSYK